MRRWISSLAAILAGIALVNLALAVPVGAEDRTEKALEIVKTTSEQMIEILERRRSELQEHPERIYDVVREIVVPHFDFVRMSQLVLGKYGRRATPEQRRRFVEEFRTLLVRSYGTTFLEYSDETIAYLPLRAEPDATDVTVRTEIRTQNGPPVPVNYSMYWKDGTWKVYDVVVDGVSLVINYRTSFSEQIARVGIDGLIERLAERNSSEKK